MFYIVLSILIMTIREVYANKGLKNISVKSWLWVILAPITLPITIGVAVYDTYKEIKKKYK
jgi:hypothetical protein